MNAALRALAPAAVCRVQFRARPTPRDIRHVLFEALGIGGSEQVLAIIPAYHPVWAGAEAADIAYTDAQAGHGNFRAWSKITSHVVTGLARLERDVADRDVLQWVFSRLSGSSA